MAMLQKMFHEALYAIGLRKAELRLLGDWLATALAPKPKLKLAEKPERAAKVSKRDRQTAVADAALEPIPVAVAGEVPKIKAPKLPPKESPREQREAQSTFDFVRPGGFLLPELAMLAKPKPRAAQSPTEQEPASHTGSCTFD